MLTSPPTGDLHSLCGVWDAALVANQRPPCKSENPIFGSISHPVSGSFCDCAQRKPGQLQKLLKTITYSWETFVCLRGGIGAWPRTTDALAEGGRTEHAHPA